MAAYCPLLLEIHLQGTLSQGGVNKAAPVAPRCCQGLLQVWAPLAVYRREMAKVSMCLPGGMLARRDPSCVDRSDRTLGLVVAGSRQLGLLTLLREEEVRR